MISQKQRDRHARLVKRYKALGVASDQASILATCVIQRRGGFGLFRSLGAPAQKLRGVAEERIQQQKEDLWSMKQPVLESNAG